MTIEATSVISPAHLSDSLSGGFADPVFDSQAVFGRVMNAMARPGSIHPLPAFASAPGTLLPTTAALLCALCDADTPVWFDFDGSQGVADWLYFHTNAPVAAQPKAASFVVIARPDGELDLDIFAQGSQEYPDRSATLIIQTDTLEAGEGWSLSGPGIKDSTGLALAPVPAGFEAQWVENRQRFPRGVDVIFAGPAAIAALARTTVINTGKDEGAL